MKKFVMALAVLMFSSLAVAQSKVAVLDIQRAIMSTESAQKQLQALKTKPSYADLVNSLEALKADLMDLKKEQDANQLTWTPEQVQDFKNRVAFKRQEMKLQTEKLQVEEAPVIQKIMGSMVEAAKAATNEIVVAEGITLLLNAQSGNVMYVAPTSNITAKVTAKLNKSIK